MLWNQLDDPCSNNIIDKIVSMQGIGSCSTRKVPIMSLTTGTEVAILQSPFATSAERGTFVCAYRSALDNASLGLAPMATVIVSHEESESGKPPFETNFYEVADLGTDIPMIDGDTDETTVRHLFGLYQRLPRETVEALLAEQAQLEIAASPEAPGEGPWF